MPKRISITLLFTVLFAVVALFAATQAGAFSAPDGKCPEVEATNFECFVDEVAGYVVEVVPCFDNGRLVFPCPRSGNTRFDYKITAIGTKKIDYINLLTSVCTPELVIVSTSPPQFIEFTGGAGDTASKFGRGLTLDNTLRVDNYKKKGGRISVTLQGIVSPNHKAMGLIESSDWRKWGMGEILGPACSPLENEPVSSETVFVGADFTWKLKYDEGGNSNDAECVPPGDCTVETLLVNQIPFGAAGFLDSLPIDEGLVVGDSPGCTYVRTRSGGVKRLCN